MPLHHEPAPVGVQGLPRQHVTRMGCRIDHDLGDLSYMIECYCQDTSLLTRCDALVERHAAALRESSGGSRQED